MADSFFILANQIVNNPSYRPLLSIVKGLRNGIVYGCKIRFPHALVMTFLFRQGTLNEKIRGILIATMTHAKNLAHFTLIYKTVIYLIRLVVREIKQHHTIFAAFLGGYYVFGKKNSINEQINMYLLSRTLFGLARVAQEKGLVPEVVTKHQVFSRFSAIVWGTALWLFEYHIHTLQPGLQSSMTYLYHDSQKWDSFKNFLIYNK